MRKWLNISAKDSDYSADTEDDEDDYTTDTEFDTEGTNSFFGFLYLAYNFYLKFGQLSWNIFFFFLFVAEFCEWPTESRYKDDQGNDINVNLNGNVFLFISMIWCFMIARSVDWCLMSLQMLEQFFSSISK